MGKHFQLVVCAALLSLAACEKSNKADLVTIQSPVKVNNDAINAEVEAAKAKLEAQKQALKSESQAKLKQLDAKLEELKRSAAAHSAHAKRAGDDTLNDLARKRDEARAALARAEGASREQWESLKSGASQAMDGAERAYNDALDKLKTD
jgi:DNA repair exonuclease SbcCD ATPase subunit